MGGVQFGYLISKNPILYQKVKHVLQATFPVSSTNPIVYPMFMEALTNKTCQQ